MVFTGLDPEDEGSKLLLKVSNCVPVDMISQNLKKKKGKFHPMTGHEGPEGG
jgi:hypothetical protein